MKERIESSEHPQVALFKREFSTYLVPNLVDTNANLTAVSIGCGSIGPWEAEALVSLYPHATYTGIDISPHEIELAQTLKIPASLANHVQFVVADAQTLPENVHDLVILRRPNIYRGTDLVYNLARTGARSLRPRGILYVATDKPEELENVQEYLEQFTHNKLVSMEVPKSIDVSDRTTYSSKTHILIVKKLK